MYCAACGEHITEEFVYHARQLAICPHCKNVHNLQLTPRMVYQIAKRDDPVTLQNPRIKMEHTPDGIVITQRSFQGLSWQIVIALLAVFTVAPMLISPPENIGDPSVMGLLGALFLLLSPFLYTALTQLTNTTRIIISPSAIKVARGPLPMQGNQTVPLENIVQVIVREVEAPMFRGAIDYSYELNLVIAHVGSKVLLRGIADAGDALMLGHLIETYLSIADHEES